MSDELKHECGIGALYWMDKAEAPEGMASEAVQDGNVTRLMPNILLNLQNRGQLAAGLSSYNPERIQRLDTYKALGPVNEAFQLSIPSRFESIVNEYEGIASIGHVRYATSGKDDVRYAQPFERHHGRLWKWFSFAFNGQLANYQELKNKILSKNDYYFAMEGDTEVIMHELSYYLRGETIADLKNVFSSLVRDFDGAYNIVFLDAKGRMVVARDPLGLRPLSYGFQGRLFGAASESVALTNQGFENVVSLPPGHMIIIDQNGYEITEYAKAPRKAHCFFEWVYFSNVASEQDDTNVYVSRAESGRLLAEMEKEKITENSIVVPVPDTAKAAADSYAFSLKIPCVEGLMRNRYVGRTFIQSGDTRYKSARSKYTPISRILEGKKVFLVEDSVVRSTTLRVLVDQIRGKGGAAEVHVRVACPPITAPCFYGIDMSTVNELFAPKFLNSEYNGIPDEDMQARMADVLGVDSIQYLPVPALGEALNKSLDDLCLGCVTGKYPTEWGTALYDRACKKGADEKNKRTYE